MYGVFWHPVTVSVRGAALAVPRICTGVSHRARPRAFSVPRALPSTANHTRWYASKAEEDEKDDGFHAPAVQSQLTVVEKTEWEEKWKKFKETAFQSKIFEHVNEGREKIDDFIEDSDNIFVRGIRRAKNALFSETEEAMALKEIQRLDPSWEGPLTFTDWLEADVLENWVSSFLRGDQEGIEFMRLYCTERAMVMAVQYFKQREQEAPGCRMDDRVLIVEDVEYETAALMDDGQPVIIVNFAAQGIECFWNEKGEVVHGDETAIEKTYYRWAMQLDSDLEDEEGNPLPAEWKLAEWFVRAKIPLAI